MFVMTSSDRWQSSVLVGGCSNRSSVTSLVQMKKHRFEKIIITITLVIIIMIIYIYLYTYVCVEVCMHVCVRMCLGLCNLPFIRGLLGT